MCALKNLIEEAISLSQQIEDSDLEIIDDKDWSNLTTIPKNFIRIQKPSLTTNYDFRRNDMCFLGSRYFFEIIKLNFSLFEPSLTLENITFLQVKLMEEVQDSFLQLIKKKGLTTPSGEEIIRLKRKSEHFFSSDSSLESLGYVPIFKRLMWSSIHHTPSKERSLATFQYLYSLGILEAIPFYLDNEKLLKWAIEIQFKPTIGSLYGYICRVEKNFNPDIARELLERNPDFVSSAIASASSLCLIPILDIIWEKYPLEFNSRTLETAVEVMFLKIDRITFSSIQRTIAWFRNKGIEWGNNMKNYQGLIDFLYQRNKVLTRNLIETTKWPLSDEERKKYGFISSSEEISHHAPKKSSKSFFKTIKKLFR